MKAARKSKPTAPRRGRPARFGGDRQIVGARLPPETYQRLVEASAANRTSISAEIEKRIERSFEDDATNPGNKLVRLAMKAFEGAWQWKSPDEDWMGDPLGYDGGVIRACEVLLAQHPKPDFDSFFLLLLAFRSRLEERLLAVCPHEDRTLPGLDWGSRRREPKPDTKEKDEG